MKLSLSVCLPVSFFPLQPPLAAPTTQPAVWVCESVSQTFFLCVFAGSSISFRPPRPTHARKEPRSSSPPRPITRANMTDTSTNMRLKLPITCIILEIILIILFGTLVEYNVETDARKWHNTTHQDYENDFYFRYPSEWHLVRLQSRSSYFWMFFFFYTATGNTLKGKFRECLHGQHLQFSLHFSYEILCI